MATILKIVDGDNDLEVMPISENVMEVWIGKEEDDQSWRCVKLDKNDATNLIRFIQEQLESEK